MGKDKKVALVISGGGAKGAFAVGVIERIYDKFRDSGWFSIVGGTSVGSLIAPLAAVMGAPRPLADEARETLDSVFTQVTTRDILHRQSLIGMLQRPSTINESAPLKALVEERFRPEWFEWLRSGDSPHCYLVYINFHSGKKILVSARDNDMDRQRFITCMMASASVPVFMQPTVIDGEICYDGGVRDVLPFEKAIELGAELIVPVYVDPGEMPYAPSRFRRMDQVLLRTISIFLDETRQNDSEMANLAAIASKVKNELLNALKDDSSALSKVEEILSRPEYERLFGRGRNLQRIQEGLRPDKPLGNDLLSFRPAKMSEWIKLGKDKAEEVLRVSPFV